jgi:nitrogen regulatory protein P-II 2
MKLIKCIVRTDKLSETTDALEALGISGLTIMEVRGRGSTRSTALYRGRRYPAFLHMTAIDVIVDDDLVDDVVHIVLDRARTGVKGDGRIMIVNLENCYTIRTRQGGVA